MAVPDRERSLFKWSFGILKPNNYRSMFLVLHLETLFVKRGERVRVIRHIKIWFYELYMNLHECHKYSRRVNSLSQVQSYNFTSQRWREITQGSSLRDRPMTARAGCEDNEIWNIKLGTTRRRWVIVYFATIHNRTHFVVCNKVLSRITSPMVGEGAFLYRLADLSPGLRWQRRSGPEMRDDRRNLIDARNFSVVEEKVNGRTRRNEE